MTRLKAARLDREAALSHALAVLAPVVTVSLLLSYVMHHDLAVDFRGEYWIAARRVLAGHDPYLWNQAQILDGIAFPYPAPAALLLIPFGLLPQAASAAVFVTLSLAAVAVTLRVLWVRDWRVYALAFVLWPVISAWQSGNVTLVLALLIALVWRYRERPIASGLLAALAISLKPLVWPLGLWLLATRRWRSAAWALAGGVIGNAIAWGVVGFGKIGQYLALDHRVTVALYHSGYSLFAIALRLDTSRGVALGALVLVSAMIACGCLRLGARRRDDAALALAVGLMLAASPLVWNHYLALLIVPVAILRPRLGPEWLVMLVLWLCPALHVREWEALLAALTAGGVIWALVRDPAGRRLPATASRRRAARAAS